MLEPDEVAAQAQAHEDAGEWDCAVSLWSQIAETEPWVTARLGHACLRAGLIDRGEQLLRASIKSRPEEAEGYEYLGSFCYEQGRLAEARDLLLVAESLNSRSDVLVILGQVFRQFGEPEKSRDYFTRALQLVPTNADAVFGLGLLSERHDDSEALRLFIRAIDIDPTLGPAHREVGYVLWRLGRCDEAEDAVRKALALDDSDPWAHIYLGQLLLDREAVHDAEIQLKRATELWPELPLPHCYLGDALAGQGRFGEAKECYARALSLDISGGLANLRFGQILKKEGHLDAAKTYLQRALSVSSTADRARRALADLE